MPQNLLKQKNSYFRNLSSDGQQRFLTRVLDFMENKKFVGREGLVVTDEIRLLISASAVQLTFGFREYSIAHLHTINVFPRVFYSRLYETSFKGLTTTGGVISLSWDDFREGYADETDKMNLGLHELAHALNVDWDQANGYDSHLFTQYEKWKVVAKRELEELKAEGKGFLRKYASINLNEFFAVCIEHFFEAPADFRKQLPELYAQTVFMLNQDPENAAEDYKMRHITKYFTNGTNTSTDLSGIQSGLSYEDQFRENKLQYFIRTKGVYVAMGSTFSGLFIGVPLLFWFSSVILLDVGTLLLLIFLCGSLGLLQWRFVRDYIDMHYHQFAMYAFTGFGLCFINFLLFLNLNIRINQHTETYAMEHIHINEKNLNVRIGDSESSPLAKNLTYFLQSNFSEIPESDNITIVYETGLLGFDVIRSCVFN
jgi:Mlc titration factor MtfA (ptsG expression regulator)